MANPDHYRNQDMKGSCTTPKGFTTLAELKQHVCTEHLGRCPNCLASLKIRGLRGWDKAESEHKCKHRGINEAERSTMPLPLEGWQRKFWAQLSKAQANPDSHEWKAFRGKYLRRPEEINDDDAYDWRILLSEVKFSKDTMAFDAYARTPYWVPFPDAARLAVIYSQSNNSILPHEQHQHSTDYTQQLHQAANLEPQSHNDLDPIDKALIARMRVPPIDDSGYGGSNETEEPANDIQPNNSQKHIGNSQFHWKDMAYETPVTSAEAHDFYGIQEGSLVPLSQGIETATYWSHGSYAADINEEEPL